MKIKDVFNIDFMKILNFFEEYEEELFTQQTLINKNVTYYLKVAYFINIFENLGIIESVKITGMGNIKLYKLNKKSTMYDQIKELIKKIKD